MGRRRHPAAGAEGYEGDSDESNDVRPVAGHEPHRAPPFTPQSTVPRGARNATSRYGPSAKGMLSMGVNCWPPNMSRSPGVPQGMSRGKLIFTARQGRK